MEYVVTDESRVGKFCFPYNGYCLHHTWVGDGTADTLHEVCQAIHQNIETFERCPVPGKIQIPAKEIVTCADLKK
jgi:hypothetical protein